MAENTEHQSPFDDGSWRHRNVGRVMANALKRFEHRVLEVLAQHGHGEIRYSHISLTRNLDVSGTITSELARRAGMTKQAMGEIVDQCERLGLVERVPDVNDARARIVRFTPSGLEWLAAFRTSLQQAEQEMREEVGFLRIDAIVSALESYGRAYDELEP